MSSGATFTLGFMAGVLLTSVVFVTMRSRRVQPPPAELVAQVSEETMARARELVARGRIVHAVKAVRDETGWDLKHAKAVVDGMPRSREKDDGFGNYGIG